MFQQWYYSDKETQKLVDELFGFVQGTVDQRVKTSENKESFVATVILPGAERKDIRVSEKNGVLTVSYKPEKENPYTKSFVQSWNTTDLDVMELTATYRDGLLTVTVPKVKKKEPEIREFRVA